MEKYQKYQFVGQHGPFRTARRSPARLAGMLLCGALVLFQISACEVFESPGNDDSAELAAVLGLLVVSGARFPAPIRPGSCGAQNSESGCTAQQQGD